MLPARKNGRSCLGAAIIDCLEMAINFPEAMKKLHWR